MKKELVVRMGNLLFVVLSASLMFVLSCSTVPQSGGNRQSLSIFGRWIYTGSDIYYNARLIISETNMKEISISNTDDYADYNVLEYNGSLCRIKLQVTNIHWSGYPYTNYSVFYGYYELVSNQMMIGYSLSNYETKLGPVEGSNYYSYTKE